MTIDERIEKLTERHEALAQSVELLTSDVREMQTTISEGFRRQAENLDKLTAVVDKAVQLILNHDERVTRLEGGQ